LLDPLLARVYRASFQSMARLSGTIERHPFSGATYQALDVDRVLVEHNGTSGVFSRSGLWIEGELRAADPQLCRWVISEILTNALLDDI
jgi:hypothetical protein